MSKFELFAVILVGAFLIALPVCVGAVCFQIYRKIKPFPAPDERATSFLHLDNFQHDGFIKCTLLGCVICAPIYYLSYQYFTSY